MEATAERFVAFIDILGFKDFVGKHTHDEVLIKLNKMAELVKNIKNVNNSKEEQFRKVFKDVQLIPYIFSDSVAIFTSDNSYEAVLMLLITCQFIFGASLEAQIPIKAAIAYGKITVDTEKSIFFGQPIIDAFLLQEELKYYGLILHNSAELKIREIDNAEIRLHSSFLVSRTPTKHGLVSYYNLRWNKSNPYFNSEKGKSTIEAFYSMVSGPPRVYVDNTLDMLEKMSREE